MAAAAVARSTGSHTNSELEKKPASLWLVWMNWSINSLCKWKRQHNTWQRERQRAMMLKKGLEIFVGKSPKRSIRACMTGSPTIMDLNMAHSKAKAKAKAKQKCVGQRHQVETLCTHCQLKPKWLEASHILVVRYYSTTLIPQWVSELAEAMASYQLYSWNFCKIEEWKRKTTTATQQKKINFSNCLVA